MSRIPSQLLMLKLFFSYWLSLKQYKETTANMCNLPKYTFTTWLLTLCLSTKVLSALKLQKISTNHCAWCNWGKIQKSALRVGWQDEWIVAVIASCSINMRTEFAGLAFNPCVPLKASQNIFTRHNSKAHWISLTEIAVKKQGKKEICSVRAVGLALTVWLIPQW